MVMGLYLSNSLSSSRKEDRRLDMLKEGECVFLLMFLLTFFKLGCL